MKKTHRYSRSQVEINAKNDEKFISKDDTLSSISQIEKVEDQAQGKNNESRDDYAQVLGTLTQRNKSQLEIGLNTITGANLTQNQHSTHRRHRSKQPENPKKTLGISRSNFLPTLNSRINVKKIEPATRQRRYVFKFNKKSTADANVKAYNIPETKYDLDTIQDMKIQYMIIYNEINCLLDKSKLLQNENIGVALYHFKKITLASKRSFNNKFEKL